ncbi:MAG TPA: hypothetical protein V6C81_20345 [Planktothrix sp.]|jgi:hypothetical protein
MNEIGKLQLESGDLTGAEESFKHVLEQAQKCHLALFEIALAFGHDGKKIEAAGSIIEFHKLHANATVPNWLIDIAKSVPADKLPPPLVPPPAQKPAGEGESSSPSGF